MTAIRTDDSRLRSGADPDLPVACGSYVLARIPRSPPASSGFGSAPMACPSSDCHAFRSVFVFTASAPAIQVFLPTMGAFERRQLILQFGHGPFASCRWECNGNDDPACPALTQPPEIVIPWNHLLLRPQVDTARGDWGHRPSQWRTLALGRTFDRHWSLCA